MAGEPSWGGRPAGRTYAAMRIRALADSSPARSITLVFNGLARSRTLLRTRKELMMT